MDFMALHSGSCLDCNPFPYYVYYVLFLQVSFIHH